MSKFIPHPFEWILSKGFALLDTCGKLFWKGGKLFWRVTFLFTICSECGGGWGEHLPLGGQVVG